MKEISVTELTPNEVRPLEYMLNSMINMDRDLTDSTQDANSAFAQGIYEFSTRDYIKVRNSLPYIREDHRPLLETMVSVFGMAMEGDDDYMGDYLGWDSVYKEFSDWKKYQ